MVFEKFVHSELVQDYKQMANKHGTKKVYDYAIDVYQLYQPEVYQKLETEQEVIESP